MVDRSSWISPDRQERETSSTPYSRCDCERRTLRACGVLRNRRLLRVLGLAAAGRHSRCSSRRSRQPHRLCLRADSRGFRVRRQSVRSIRRDLHCCVAGMALADRRTSADAHRHDRGCPGYRWSPAHHWVRRAGSLSVCDRPPRLAGRAYRTDSGSPTCTAGCPEVVLCRGGGVAHRIHSRHSRETPWARLAAAERRIHTPFRQST